jgi:hypothetical protein
MRPEHLVLSVEELDLADQFVARAFSQKEQQGMEEASHGE